jgi:omega-6 fatty acid desaturase (delta-12 desaturase)
MEGSLNLMNSQLRIIDFVNAMPKHLKKPVEWRSWATLFRCFLVILIFQFAIFHLPFINAENFFWNLPIHFVLIFFAGLSLVGLFVLCHDCGHYSFSRYNWVNNLVGFICFIPLLSNLFSWRVGHNFHHQNNQIRRVDPDWPELLSTAEEYALLPWYEKLAIRIGLGSVVGILVGFWVGMIKRSFFTVFIPQMNMNFKKAFSLYFMNLLSAFLSVLLIWVYQEYLGFEKFILMYLIPVLIAASTGAFLTFIQHSQPGSYVFDKKGFDPVLSHVHSTSNIRFPKWMEFFWLDINVHTPHHVLPAIPWYYLKEANDALKAQFPDLINERIFSFQGLKKSWKATELVRVKEGIYKIQ